MLPHCGHFFIAPENGYRVRIMGCDTGVDWSTTHLDSNIIIRFGDGKSAMIEKYKYRAMAVQFATEVVAFYDRSKPKIPDSDEWSQRGYVAFRTELRDLLAKANN